MFFLLLAACAPKAPPAPLVRALPDATAELQGEIVIEGPLPSRVRPPDPAVSLRLFYGGEEKGSLEPCGCPNRPRGGVARAAALIAAARQADPALPTFVVNGGYWLEDAMSLDGQPRADVPLLNRWMVRGMASLGPDALNAAYNDMAGLTSLGGPPPEGLPLVSANVSGAGIEPVRWVQAGALKVAITGITAPGVTFLPTPGFVVREPVAAAGPLLEALDAEADLVVLLAYGDPEAASKLARKGHVDVVIDTNLHREAASPFRVGDAVWVYSHFETMRLGELRLEVAEGRVVRALDRKIDLDPTVPEEPALSAIAATARAEISLAQKTLFGSGFSGSPR